MPAFLDVAWVDALATAARRAPPLSGEAAEATLTVEHVVEGAPGGPTAYSLRIAGGRVAVVAGRAPDADLTVVTSYPVAVELSTGAANAQDALAAGGLKLRGDLGALVRARVALETLGDLFADVRAGTTYDRPAAPREEDR